MVVDDNPASRMLLENMLRQQHYEAHSFPRGRLALAAAAQNPPDLIMLDINMPEMNGYTVCEHLQSSSELAGIPVIFLSDPGAAEDRMHGFRSGGVGYISRPFRFEQVHASVETHLKLWRAQRAEHDLLERTLNGSVVALWELMRLKSLMLALRSHAILGIVRWIATRMAIGDPWPYEVAAALSLVGCIELPDEIIEKAYGGQNLSPAQEHMFRAHPEGGARLLANIPRLESVAEMIRGQQAPETEQFTSSESRLGARMLYLALQIDQMVYRGANFHSALDHLRMLPGCIDTRMLQALAGYFPTPAEWDVRWARIRDLRLGMILDENVVSNANLLILKEGTVLTEMWIERLENFASVGGVQELIGVRIPKLGRMRMCSRADRTHGDPPDNGSVRADLGIGAATGTLGRRS